MCSSPEPAMKHTPASETPPSIAPSTIAAGVHSASEARPYSHVSASPPLACLARKFQAACAPAAVRTRASASPSTSCLDQFRLDQVRLPTLRERHLDRVEVARDDRVLEDRLASSRISLGK